MMGGLVQSHVRQLSTLTVEDDLDPLATSTPPKKTMASPTATELADTVAG